MSHPFAYPEHRDDETGADYFERVRQMGLPMPWESDKIVPPGPITVDKQYSTRDPAGVGQLAKDKQQALERLAQRPGHTLHVRPRWVAVGEWTQAVAEDHA